MNKFYVVMLPANTIDVQHDVFYTSATAWGNTDFIEEATRFKTETDASNRRGELNKLWRCCAQVRAVEIVPPVAERLKLLPAGI